MGLKFYLILACFPGIFALISGLVGIAAIRLFTKSRYPWAMASIGALTSALPFPLFAIGECQIFHQIPYRVFLLFFFYLFVNALLTCFASKWWFKSRVCAIQNVFHVLCANALFLLACWNMDLLLSWICDCDYS